MIPFTQTLFWAELNSYYHGLLPKTVKNCNISCLFGIDNHCASWTSFGGPILYEDTTPEEFESFLIELISQAKTDRIHHVNLRSLFPLRPWQPEFEKRLLKLGFIQQEWKTFIIDLREAEDAIFKNFEHSARKGIKKAISLGVEVQRCESFEIYFSQFLIPYLKATNRQIREKEFYKTVWELESNNYYNYWIAKDNSGEILGFLGSYHYNGIATEITSALTPLAFARRIPVQDILHWEIIRHHKNLGDSYFDLAGFNPNPVSEKEKNIKRFKEKWGGKVYDVSSYIIDMRPFTQKLISKIIRGIRG